MHKDLTDREWNEVKDSFAFGVYSTKYDTRVLVNAILYVQREKCKWSQLPEKYGSWKTANRFLKGAVKRGVWAKFLEKIKI